VRSLEEASQAVRDPVAKLRFIRESLSQYEDVHRRVSGVPWASGRRMLYRWSNREGLRQLMQTAPTGTSARVAPRMRASLAAGRALTTVVTLVMLGAAAGLGTAAYRLWRTEQAPVLAHAPVAEGASARAPLAPSTIAEPATAPVGVAPAAVWQVEKGNGFEQYSNGLRIDTTHATVGEPRRYRVFAEPDGMLDTVYETPVGIVFHTSESDVWPLEASFNENLRDTTQHLLRYVQRNRLYHYLVDRFGRVYRVVDEESKANHAGHSVWLDGGRIYLNLNHAFLGVAFETRWEGGRALPITQAQFAAGRELTDYLRQRWGISSTMCVAHGLTSVNAKKHLIGHHLDWARGFPFEAFGLPDQYRRPAPSVELFGFGYDDDFLKVLGEPWPGVRQAEGTLLEEASRQGRTVEEVRRERQDRFDRWLAIQAGEDVPETARRATQARAKSPRSIDSGG
jgi:N-acetylmuramoyl-L-alanine amidase-like protein